uniref:Uncharacterized protein n=1 Tax=Avena sativa TaxID=4498 RepID=A0ACD6AJY2_AVESA
MPPPHRHALLLAALLLLLLLAATAAAQPDERGPWYRRSDAGADDDDDDGGVMPGARKQTSFSAPMVVLLVALIATFFFIGFFSIYIRQCGRGASPARSVPAAALLALSRQEQQQQPDRQMRGLHPDVLASFPTMTYAEARALREGSGKQGGDDAALECAVCLSEFEDEEKLRLLPECSHAFHPDCIGEWLAAHVTCPVCRRSLVPPEEKPADTAAEANGSQAEEQRPEVAIDVNREGGEEDEERRELERIGSLRRAVRSRSGRPFSRAHSTGHSLSARLDGDLERFTLRLPEQVRREMMAAAGEESLRRTVGRSARIGRSDRWPSFIARTFSSSRVPFWAASRRAPSDVEAAGSTTTTPATIHEKTTVDASASSAKGSLRFDCLGVGGVTGARVSSAAGDSEDEPEEEKAIVRRV